MTPLLFSLPVHERPDIVADQLDALRHACPQSLACIHVSAAATAELSDFVDVAREKGACVNARRLQTGHGTGLLHVHLSNVRAARAQGVQFERVALISSNEMPVRTGLEDHVRRHVAGLQLEPFDLATDWHLFHRRLEAHPAFSGLMQHLGLRTWFGGQAEGQFFHAAVFDEIERLSQRFFGEAPAGFESEEVVPATICAVLLRNVGNLPPPFTLQNYCHEFVFDDALVDALRAGCGMVVAPRRRGTLRSPHVGQLNLGNVYAIKRVDREWSALRQRLRHLRQGEVQAAGSA